MTYLGFASPTNKPLAWIHAEVRSPPFSKSARLEAGFLLRLLQGGEVLSMPHARPMPDIGRRCHELRIQDQGSTWRIMYRVDPDAIVIADVFSKKTRATPQGVLDTCRRRLREYDNA